jgi:hypothetical protein
MFLLSASAKIQRGFLASFMDVTLPRRRRLPMTFTAWRTRRLRVQQKQKALQMLALSGVVRPSDVELHYPIPLIKISGTHTAPETRSSSNELMARPLPKSAPQPPLQDTHRFQWLRQELTAASQ